VGNVSSCGGITNELKALKGKSLADDSPVLVSSGYDQDLLKGKRYLTAADLDAVFPTNPVIVKHSSGQMLVATTAAMDLTDLR